MEELILLEVYESGRDQWELVYSKTDKVLKVISREKGRIYSKVFTDLIKATAQMGHPLS